MHPVEGRKGHLQGQGDRAPDNAQVANQEHVTLGEQTDERVADQLGLARDPLGDGVLDLRPDGGVPTGDGLGVRSDGSLRSACVVREQVEIGTDDVAQ